MLRLILASVSLLLFCAQIVHAQSTSDRSQAAARDDAVRSTLDVGGIATETGAAAVGTARVVTNLERSLGGTGFAPHVHHSIDDASLYRHEVLDGRSKHLKNAGKFANATGNAFALGSLTYNATRCYQGADCWPAVGDAFGLMADVTPGGRIASSAINIVDGGWRAINPKGRGGVEAAMDEALYPLIAPSMGLEWVDEWDSYAKHEYAAQFRHNERVAEIAEQKIQAREFAETFNPVYTPRDGGGAYDPLAELLRATQAAVPGNCTDEDCASPVSEPQENECDHVGHDPIHICDASGRTISRGGGS